MMSCDVEHIQVLTQWLPPDQNIPVTEENVVLKILQGMLGSFIWSPDQNIPARKQIGFTSGKSWAKYKKYLVGSCHDLLSTYLSFSSSISPSLQKVHKVLGWLD